VRPFWRGAGRDPGCVKTKTDLVLMLSSRQIFAFFSSAHDHRTQNFRCGHTASSFHTAWTHTRLGAKKDDAVQHS
jgi:hypothetical protein